MGAALPWIIGGTFLGSKGVLGPQVQEFLQTPAERAAVQRQEALAGAFEQVGPRLSQILAGGVPEDISQRVIGRGEEIAGRQAEALAGRFQQFGTAFTPVHARAEQELRGDVSRQTQEALADLEFRLQSGTLGQLLATQQQPTGIPGFLEFAQGASLLAPFFGAGGEDSDTF
jgi:hypothetical protein